MRRAAAALAGAWLLAAPCEAASTGTLTVEEFLRLACANETRFEEILVEGLKLRYRRNLRLPPDDIVLSAAENLFLYPERDEKDLASSVGLSKLFRPTGTEVSAEYGVTPAAGSGKLSSEFSASVTQPIARNAFGRSIRLLDKIVGMEIEIARHQIVEAYEDFFAAVLGSYIDWWEAYENREVGRSSYAENLKLLDNINARRRSRIAKPIDVNKIELQVLAKRERLVELEERYESAYNLVKRAVRREGGAELVPAAPDKLPEPPEVFGRSYEEFKSSARTPRILRLVESKTGTETARTFDELFPSLDLKASLERSGEGGSLKNREDLATVGLALEWPVTEAVARDELRVARIEERRARLSTLSALERLRADIRNLHLAAEREKRLRSLAEEKIALSRSVLAAESEDYTYARSSLNDYIQAVNALDANRFSLIRREAEYRRLGVEWLRLTDGLVGERDLKSRHGEAADWR